MNMKKMFLILLVILSTGILFSYELCTLINSPTAGILQKGEASIIADLYKNNGLIIGTKVGLFPRFMFGVSYGGEQIVGNKNPILHERVEFNAKFRILDEAVTYPAAAFGYDSQGHGTFYESAKRYDIKSKGFYLVASKNFQILGNLGLHLGSNLSLENKDADNNLDFFAGIDKTLGDVIELLADYDLALNDNENYFDSTLQENLNGLKKGYLNAALAVHFTDYLSLKISFYDLLKNRLDTEGCDRTLTLNYQMTF